MTSVRALIAARMPESLKAPIRPLYRLVFRPKIDKASSIAISRFGGFDVAFRTNTADEDVIEESFGRDIFFAGVPEYVPAEDDVIIDVGAHIGTFALLASSKVPRGKVFAIEASQDTFNMLRINVALNQRNARISAHHLAITDRIGEITLSHDDRNWGHTVVTSLSKSAETVPCTTLSAFLDQNEIARCQFMKLNCEGAEFPILLSTSASVLQRFETLLVLYHCDLWVKNTEADLVSHLQSSGFTATIRNKSARRGWIVATRSRAR